MTLPTFFLGMLWKRTSKEGVICGLIVAIIMNISLTFLIRLGVISLPFPDYFLSIAVSIIVTVLVSFFISGAAGANMPDEFKLIYNL